MTQMKGGGGSILDTMQQAPTRASTASWQWGVACDELPWDWTVMRTACKFEYPEAAGLVLADMVSFYASIDAEKMALENKA